MSTDILCLDHYGFKPMVRYLLMLRAYRQLDELARTHRPTRVEISILERGGAENRWYPGTAEDMGSHLFMMLAYAKIGLENPQGEPLDPAEMLAKRQSFFQALSTEPRDQDLVQGCYRGFPGTTGTYFAARVRLTCADWVTIPIIIRSGKCLHENLATVRISFENRQFIEARVQPNPFLRLGSISGRGAEARYVDENLRIDPNEPGPYARVMTELQCGLRAWFLTDEEAGAVRAWLDAIGQLARRYRLPFLPYDQGSIGPSPNHPLLVET